MQAHILLTNDDGIQSPALDILAVCLAHLGVVTIVAPDREMSATSQSITLNQPLRYHQVAPNKFAVQGTPADCVILASLRILKRKPSLVISGVNRGANIGDDIGYSGTVAGALEAALEGVPAMAVSTYVRDNPDYMPAAEVTARIAAKILADGLPPDVILNVNYPEKWNGSLKVTRQGRISRKNVLVENLDPRGRQYFWLHEELHETSGRPVGTGPMTDSEAVAGGFVSISPLQIDRTAYRFFNQFSKWTETLNAEANLASSPQSESGRS